MTTIAWDGVTLAVDSQVAGAWKSRTNKLFKVTRSSIFAATGQETQIFAFANWLKCGQSGSRPETASGFRGILFNRSTGKAVQFWDDEGSAIIRRAWAAGSGADFAIAALYLGKTAKEAVQVAAALCFSTGGQIRTASSQLGKRLPV